MATKRTKLAGGDAIGSPEDEPGETAEGELTFEAAITRLSDIVERLEEGDLPLEESLRLFEEGVRLARTSGTRLDAAERRVEKLLAYDKRGAPVVEELEEA